MGAREIQRTGRRESKEMIYYTGVGSRSTPPEVLAIMTKLAYRLEKNGLMLRSGGAEGADSAFERGVSEDENKEIFLPWRGFNGNMSGLYPPTKYARDI